MQDWLCVKCSGAATLRQMRDGRVRPLCKKHGGDLPLMVRFTREVEVRFDYAGAPQEVMNPVTKLKEIWRWVPEAHDGVPIFQAQGQTADICSVCLHVYPSPISSHHTPEECAANRKPGSSLEIRGGNGTVKSEPVGHVQFKHAIPDVEQVKADAAL